MAAKSADDARKKAMMSKKAKFKPATPSKSMTKTVVSYDKATGVKILKPGSRPLTQSNTQLKAAVEKAKTKTPAARADIKRNMKLAEKTAVREVRNNRQYLLNQTMREAWQTDYKKPLTPAQIKAGNAAYEAKAKEMKSSYAKAKRAAAAAVRKLSAEQTKASIKKYGTSKSFGGGSSGGRGIAGGTSSKVGITYTK